MLSKYTGECANGILNYSQVSEGVVITKPDSPVAVTALKRHYQYQPMDVSILLLNKYGTMPGALPIVQSRGVPKQ